YGFINEAYDSEKNFLNEEEIYNIQRLSETNNVKIYVFTESLVWEFPQIEEDGQEYSRIYSYLQDYIFRGINKDITAEELTKNKNYSIYKLYDKKIDASYVELIGDLDNNYIVYMRTNLESIQESVVIANRFIAIAGTVAIIFGSIIMFYISNKFTKPILELSEIAKKMKDLDFSIEYEVDRKDEIGVLGNYINSLSKELEYTISELKNANNEMRLVIESKTKINERQQDFVSNISHELKTPIAIIQGYAEGLKENVYEDEENRDYYCDVIIDEAYKMNQMVKKLISLSYLESGESQIEFVNFDIVALIKEIVKSKTILFEQKDISFIFNYTEAIYVWGDVYATEEVINNYVSNAINHADNERVIEINLEHRDNSLRVNVFNSGKNIPENELDKVWDKFYKVDKARTREYGGSGIGLSIVKAIMNSLNQEFGVKNYSNGVEFWFELDTKAT
ncbi:MAG TPA: HAMP domain-containing histidine kinase, partial [Clostridiales bacterium]|nr:HAMP domain-containing histidine kinase [Clostridiales bacterium]